MENQVDLDLEKKLQELQKQLSKKNLFEEAVTSIRSLLQKHYLSASLSLKKSVRFLFSFSFFNLLSYNFLLFHLQLFNLCVFSPLNYGFG